MLRDVATSLGAVKQRRVAWAAEAEAFDAVPRANAPAWKTTDNNVSALQTDPEFAESGGGCVAVEVRDIPRTVPVTTLRAASLNRPELEETQNGLQKPSGRAPSGPEARSTKLFPLRTSQAAAKR